MIRNRFSSLASAVFLLMLALTACADRPPLEPGYDSALSAGGIRAEEPIVVMTRNLYLGADFSLVISHGDVQTAFGQVLQTDYPVRARVLAQEIADARPALVGLQEVTKYRIELADGTHIPYPPFGFPLDFLDVLMAELAALGESYVVVQRLDNVSVALPLGAEFPGLFIRYTDGDAIIARSDVPVTGSGGEHFQAQVVFELGPLTFKNKRGWGWADVLLNGIPVRFANSHLEVQSFAAVQEAQAAELVARLAGVQHPVILVGDFNSAANPGAPREAQTGSYKIFRQANFADLWLREPQSNRGFTCCHAADLSNTRSELDQRLDIIFVRWGSASFGGRSLVRVVGDEESDIFRHPTRGYTLWPSDHAGVVAWLWPAPGQLRKF